MSMLGETPMGGFGEVGCVCLGVYVMEGGGGDNGKRALDGPVNIMLV